MMAVISDVNHEIDCRTAWLGCPPYDTPGHCKVHCSREGCCISKPTFISSDYQNNGIVEHRTNSPHPPPQSPASPPEPLRYRRQVVPDSPGAAHTLHTADLAAPTSPGDAVLAPPPPPPQLQAARGSSKRKDYALPSDALTSLSPDTASGVPVADGAAAGGVGLAGAGSAGGGAPTGPIDTSVRSKVSSKIECLRESLEDLLGTDTFFVLYQRLKSNDGQADDTLFAGMELTDAQSRVCNNARRLERRLLFTALFFVWRCFRAVYLGYYVLIQVKTAGFAPIKSPIHLIYSWGFLLRGGEVSLIHRIL